MAPASQPGSEADRLVDLTPWLRLRWLFFALPFALEGLAALDAGLVVLASGWLPRAVLWGLPILMGLSNRHLVQRLERQTRDPEGPLFLALLADAIAITGVLAVTGGSSNPLSTLYLFPVLLAALLLDRRRAWTVLIATAAGYASLFVLHPPHHHGAHTAMSGHFVGMFLAYAVIGPAVVYAILRSRAALRLAEDRNREAHNLRDRTERLTALATLAAGASHELATPLSTILVVARELEVAASTDDAREDARLIHDEVMRCREILHQLSADAGAGLAEVPSEVSISHLLQEAAALAPGATVEADDRRVVLPRRLISHALRRLVGNAREASEATSNIHLSADSGDAEITFIVSDEGRGMAPEVLARATEPFFTTRPPGSGTGLGLFFVDSVAHHLDGTLTLESTAGQGTTARLTIPCTVGALP